MEQGRIASIHRCGGIIVRPGDVGVRFYSQGVVRPEQDNLKKGDTVMFEMQTSDNDRMAVNIRKCNQERLRKNV